MRKECIDIDVHPGFSEICQLGRFVDFVGLVVKPATPFKRMPPFGWVRRRLNGKLSLADIIPFPVTVAYARA